MDLFGFVFENFDVIGCWWDCDEGDLIDVVGVLFLGEFFNGYFELCDVFLSSKKEELICCVVKKFLMYVLGCGLEYYDECVVDEIVEKVS